MDDIIQKAIAQNEAAKKTSVPWKADEPHPQLFHLFDNSSQKWEPQTPTSSVAAAYADAGPGPSRLALLTWNIDFMLPFAESRMKVGLDTLKDIHSQTPSSTAAVILLQECVHSDLSTIARQPWIREHFVITDLTGDNWASGRYGTTTLVDRRIPVASLFRVHYGKTQMERDALFVDVLMGSKYDKKLRLCNTHLESLANMPPNRPHQVELFSQYLKEDELFAGIAAGDFNAIQDFDRTLHLDNGLKDAYLELGGKEDSDEGYTWGQQASTFLRRRFGCSRMDKIYYTGALKLKSFDRFGADVQLSDDKERNELLELGFEDPWITDHLGVIAQFDIQKSDG